MSKFITAVSMACTQEQYEQDLRKPLLVMGYKESQFDRFKDFPFLINNIGGEIGYLSNSRDKDKYNRYFIDHYNPELYLALAAMTKKQEGYSGGELGELGGKGEWVKQKNGEIAHELKHEGQWFNCFFRKMTKQELINKFTSKMEKKDLRELLQSGRIVELRRGDMGVLIQTHKGMLVNFIDSYSVASHWDNDLKNINGKKFDIVRIREINGDYQILRKHFKEAPIIWERKEVKEYTLDEVLKMAGLNKAEVKVVG